MRPERASRPAMVLSCWVGAGVGVGSRVSGYGRGRGRCRSRGRGKFTCFSTVLSRPVHTVLRMSA